MSTPARRRLMRDFKRYLTSRAPNLCNVLPAPSPRSLPPARARPPRAFDRALSSRSTRTRNSPFARSAARIRFDPALPIDSTASARMSAASSRLLLVDDDRSLSTLRTSFATLLSLYLSLSISLPPSFLPAVGGRRRRVP